MNRTATLFALCAVALSMPACKDGAPPPAAPVAASTTAPAAPASAPAPPAAAVASAPAPGPAQSSADPPRRWIGKWTGPEGTFLTLAANGARYDITIQSLDGPARYEGTAVGDRIEFMRNGPESIRAGNGDDTGMKWLAGKSDCLVIKTGEGFCRD